MAGCCKIIRLLKEVKRRADTSFCEINEKITKLESKYNLLSQQNEYLKKQVEENKRAMTPAPEAAPAKVIRPKRPRRYARSKSRARSRPASRASRRNYCKPAVKKKASSARKSVTAARKMKRKGRKPPSAKGRKGKIRRRNPC